MKNAGSNHAIVETTPLIGRDCHLSVNLFSGNPASVETTPLIGRDCHLFYLTAKLRHEDFVETTPLIGRDCHEKPGPGGRLSASLNSRNDSLNRKGLPLPEAPLPVPGSPQVETTPLIGRDCHFYS